jgi:uncharacterized protein YuzE
MKLNRVRLEYDREVDAAYLTLGTGKVVESEEVKPGLIVDFDRQDRIVGIEILRFSRRFRPGTIARKGAGARSKPLGAVR